MNRKAIQVFVVFTVLVLGAGALLARVRSSYTLGEPGVKLGETPLYDTDSNLVATVSVDLPGSVMGCSSVVTPVDPLELDMLPPDTVYGRRYYKDEDAGFGAAVSVVLMGTDRTSIHKPQYCLQGQGWQIEHSEVMPVPISQPYPYDLQVMKLSLTKEIVHEGQTRNIKGYFLYWFVADDQLTPHHLERMWWMGRDLLTRGKLQRWAYVAYLSACYPGQEEQLLTWMKDFIAETVPQFQLATGPRQEDAHAEALPNSLAAAKDL